jgi:hypothetical protein
MAPRLRRFKGRLWGTDFEPFCTLVSAKAICSEVKSFQIASV